MQTIWLSPTDYVTGDPSLQISYPFVTHPDTVVTCTAPGDLKWVSMGLPLPPNARIDEVIICYEVSNPQSFISQIRLAEMKSPDHATVLHDDPTSLQSTSPASYDSHVGGLLAEGAVTLELRLNLKNTSDEIRLGAVGVTFQSKVEHCVNSIPALKALGAGVVQCLTVLGYHAPGDGGGGDFYWDASTTAPDNGGTIIAPALNPPMGRWKRLVDGPVSVKWFGAEANANYYNAATGQWCLDSGLTQEATNDAPAIVAAMAAAATVAATGAATVLIPPGSYYIKTPTLANRTFFEPVSNISVQGVGDASVLRVGPGLNAGGDFSVFYNPGAVRNVAFRHLRIDGNGPWNTSPTRSTRYHNFMIGLPGFGIKNGVRNVNIEFCRFENTNGLNTVLIGDFRSQNMATNVRVTNCSFYDVGNDPNLTDHESLWIQADGALVANNIFFNEPTNNVIKNFGGAIELHGQNLAITGNRIRNYLGGVALSIGLDRLDTKNVSFSGNVFEDVTLGIQFYQAAGPEFTNQLLKNISIVGNVFSIRPNNDRQSEAAVQLADGYSGQVGVDTLVIADNVCIYNTVTDWPDVQPMGIAWAGNMRSCTIVGNRFDGFNHGGVVLSPKAMSTGSNLCWDIKIIGNHFTDCGTSTSVSSNRTVIYIGTGVEDTPVVKRLDIQGNTFVDTLKINHVTPTIIYGVLLGSAADGIQITENVYRNIPTPILLAPQGYGIRNVQADFIASVTVSAGSDTTALAAGASRVFGTTVAVPGATASSYVTVVPPLQQVGLVFSGMVLTGDTAYIVATNASSGSLSPPAGTYALRVRRIS